MQKPNPQHELNETIVEFLYSYSEEKSDTESISTQLENLVEELRQEKQTLDQQNIEKQNSCAKETEKGIIDVTHLESYQYLNQKFQKLKHYQLKEITKEVANRVDLKVPRECKRKKEKLYVWIDKNWDILKPYIEDIQEI